MANGATREDLRRRLRELTAAQDEVIALDRHDFSAFCEEIAALRRDSIIGLVGRLTRLGMASTRRVYEVDHRITLLRQAEQIAVQHLDREQLIARLEQKRLTVEQCEHWLACRPTEVPRVNGYPVWLAATLVDVVD